jgi:predicted Na+-dependent transporter
VSDPRPAGRHAAAGGVGVVVLTGMAALAGMGANVEMRAIDWVLAGFILLATVGGGWAMLRFVQRHGGEIGEARFDTSGRERVEE